MRSFIFVLVFNLPPTPLLATELGEKVTRGSSTDFSGGSEGYSGILQPQIQSNGNLIYALES